MTADLTFRNITHREVNGIGIFAKGTLEAIYTGGDLSVTQIRIKLYSIIYMPNIDCK